MNARDLFQGHNKIAYNNNRNDGQSGNSLKKMQWRCCPLNPKTIVGIILN